MALPKADRLSRMFRYLDNLRESGVTNMFGARPYVKDAFNLGDDVAGNVLKAWMQTFDGEKSPADRAKIALESHT